MQKQHAGVHYLHTRVTVYHPCKIDLRHSKALHSCASCNFLRRGLPCSAIHYGTCHAVTAPVTAKPICSSASGPKPVLVQTYTSAASHTPKPVPSELPRPVLVQSGKTVQPSRASHPPIPIPVVSVAKKPSPVLVVVGNSAGSPHNSNTAGSPYNNNAGYLHNSIAVQNVSAPLKMVEVGGPPRNSIAEQNMSAPLKMIEVGGSPYSSVAEQNVSAPLKMIEVGPANHGVRPTAVQQIGPVQTVGQGHGAVSVHNIGPHTQVIVRTGSDGSVVGLPGGGVLVRTGAEGGVGVRGGSGSRPIGARMPVRVVVAKPSAVVSSGLNFSFSAAEDEVYPAFPVSPEDRIQLTVPSGSQKPDLHHGVLREKEPRTQDKSHLSGSDSHLTSIKDSPIRDIKTTSRAITTTITTTTTTTSTSSTSITLSSPSLSTMRLDNKENRPKGHDLPAPRVPPTACSEDIPPFYFPLGKPQAGSPGMDVLLQKAAVEFARLDHGKAYKQQMGQIAKACGFPLYWKMLLFRAAGGDKQGFLTLQSFSAMLKKLFSMCHDEASRFLRLLAKPGRMSLEFEDFVPLVQDVVDGHPGLSFLQEAPEFHSRYIHTVISRIFFSVNRSWSGHITLGEVRKSNFLQVLSTLEYEEDINQVTDYFSYEHFYVIYCKFWELDKDHDLYIDRGDLARHNDHALNSRIIDRIFSGAVTRGKDFHEGRMSYKEFVWFLIAEEDKKHPTSVEYWFRCMDLDGDGVISMYEMEYFYEEQMQKMEALGIEKLPFEDCLCQMFDLVRPRVEERITLSDLKNCHMANIFFDTFFNLDKFLEHEQRDPFANTRDVDTAGNEICDWDRYAAEEYDILVAEEGMNDQEEIHYEDDFEPDDDDDNPVDDELARLVDPPQRRVTPRLHPATDDDIYDFSSTSFGF